jgi:hypothetical protein
MPKRKNSDILRKLQDVSQLMQQNKSDQEIMTILKLPQRTLTRYKQRIHEQNKKIWYSMVHNETEGQLLMLKSSLEWTYSKAMELAESESNTSIEGIIEALHCKDDARLSIVQILKEYSEFKRQIPQLSEESTQDNEIKPYVKRVHS